MKNELKKTVELLRERVKNNINKMNANSLNAKLLLSSLPVSEYRSQRLSDLHEENKKLFTENQESIELQKSLDKFLLTYLFKEVEPAIELSEEEYYTRTIRGEIEYNEKHPYFNDSIFFERVLKFFADEEKYEICDVLLKNRT